MSNDEETIQTDVSAEEQQAEEISRKSEHDLQVEEIANRRFAQLAEAGEGIPGTEAAPAVGEADAAPERKPKEQERGSSETGRHIEFVDDNGRTIKIPATAKFRGKVDGQEFVESLDSLTRNYQKEKALAQRLGETARMQEDLRERERRIAEAEAELAKKRAQAPVARHEPVQQDHEALRERAARVYRALVEDDEEKAVATIAEQLLAGPAVASTPDPEAISGLVDTVVQRRLLEQSRASAIERVTKERQSADAQFAREYPDVVDDPDLLELMRVRAKTELQANPEQDGLQLLRTIGDELRRKFRLQPPAAEQRHRSRPPASIPPANRRAAEVAREEKPLTVEESRRASIEAIKKARGQLL